MTTNHKPLALLILGASLAFASCQDVIDIPLRDADKVLIIEGSVIGGDTTSVVHITQTTSYFSTDQPMPINDAVVTLTLPNGNSVLLPLSGNGYYQSTGNIALPESANYTLHVEQGGKTYDATSYLNPPIAIDSLGFEHSNGFQGVDSTYLVFVSFRDPIGKNYYRLKAWQNGNYLSSANDIQVFDDQLNDGNEIRIPFFNEVFNAGDTIDLEL